MKRINPQLEPLYNYNISQNENQITIILNVPNDFDANIISIDCESTEPQKFGLKVSIPNNPPFICGAIFAEVIPESVKTQIETKKTKKNVYNYFNITLDKKSKFIWPSLIVGKHPITDEIDPMSIYLISIIKLQSNKEEERVVAENEISYAVDLGLPIATRVYAEYLINNNEKEKCIELLKSSADEYNDADSMCELGRILCNWKKETIAEGLEYLKRASKLGKTEINGLIGQILSPFSNFEYDNKDPKEAVHYLQLAINPEIDDDECESEHVDIDIEIEEEEEEDKENKIENENEIDIKNENENLIHVESEKDFESEKQRFVYEKELEKILESGIIIDSENNKNKKVVFIAVGSVLLIVGIALLLRFKKKR